MNNKASYLNLLKSGEAEERIQKAKALYKACELCPRKCGINRSKATGFCNAGEKAIVSSYAPHFGEEKVLVGLTGSGTIFFGYCHLRCVFCQNHEISFDGRGRAVSNSELANTMLNLQNSYAVANINLVSPTHFLPNIIEAIFIAAKKGLHLPIVYNCSGYENIESLKLLENIVDIYMPDFKFFSNESSKKYADAPNYPEIAKAAVLEMDRQVGGLKTNANGLATRGLLIRHLVMPKNLEESKDILNFIKENLSPNCLVNVMGQYYPANQAYLFKELQVPLSYKDFIKIKTFAQNLGLRLC